MQRALSTHVFLQHRLHPTLLDSLAAGGADAVEIFAARQHFNYVNKSAVHAIGEYFRSSTLKPHSMHAPLFPDSEMGRAGAPYVNLVHPEKSRRVAAMDEIKRALEVAEQIPYKFLILHIGERSTDWSSELLDDALTAIDHLGAYARPLGVTLALENITNGATEPAHLVTILETGHFRSVGLCFDSGHALIYAAARARERSTNETAQGVTLISREEVVSHYQSALSTMLPHIVTTHLHDNDSTRDAHLWPGDPAPPPAQPPPDRSPGDKSHDLPPTGIPWPQTMAALTDAPHQPAANLEIHYTLGEDPAEVSRRATETFRFLGL